jgi:hypothetical protein
MVLFLLRGKFPGVVTLTRLAQRDELGDSYVSIL